VTAAERDELIIAHLPRVHWVAARMYEKLYWLVNFDDLVSVGVIGLIAAVDRYDPSYGVQLHTYAEHKIRGAILDSIRTSDGVAARQRKAAKRIRKTLAAIEQRLCRPAEEEEAAAELGLSLEEYRAAAEKTRPIRLKSLDSPGKVADGSVRLADTIAAGEHSQPSWDFERAELEELIQAGITSLPEIQRTVIREYFFRGQPLRVIAETLGVHLTRVSQVKIQAVERLRAYVLERWSGRKDSADDSGETRRRAGTLMAC
jgi:RNA polymerase sigma factor for flagellar operon FliA